MKNVYTKSEKLRQEIKKYVYLIFLAFSVNIPVLSLVFYITVIL